MANFVCEVLVTEAPLDAPARNQIAEQAVEKFRVQLVIIHHRIGFIAAGKPSLFMRVAGLHRNEAFRSSRWIVNELKKKVPIWKKPRFKTDKQPDAVHRAAA